MSTTLNFYQLFCWLKASPKIRKRLSNKPIKPIFKNEPTFQMKILITFIILPVDAFFHWLGMMTWRTKSTKSLVSPKFFHNYAAMDQAVKAPSRKCYKGSRLLISFLQNIRRQTKSRLHIKLQPWRHGRKKLPNVCGKKKELRSLYLTAWS